MATIEERAVFACDSIPYDVYIHSSVDCEDSFKDGYINGAAEQRAIDHSEEHLNWIIKQYHLWSYEMCHCDNNECYTFKEWIDKAMEE